MSKLYEISVVSGKYKNKDGVEKSRYQTIGSVIETKNGPMLKLDLVPLEWAGYAYINEPYDKEKPKAAEPRPNRNRDMPDDDSIPFWNITITAPHDVIIQEFATQGKFKWMNILQN